MIRGMIAASSSRRATVDPYWSGVKLLLHGDADFSDSSSVGRTLSLGGSPAISTTVKKMGAGSMQFNGTNQFATMSGNFNYGFSAGFAVSFYANFGATRNNWERIFDFGNADANNNILVAREGTTNNLWFETYNNGAASLNIGS